MRPGGWERCRQQACFSVLCILICLAQRVSAQSGFISIDCGARPGANFVDPNTTITWDADAAYLATGLSASVAAESVGSLSEPLQTLRYFPAESSPKKNCYVMPAKSSEAYLLRASFFYGNYDNRQTSVPITFQLSLDSTPWSEVSVDPKSIEPLVLEAIRVPLTGDELSVCLIRTDDSLAPFINTLEARPTIGYASYTHAQTGGNLHLLSRANFGERVNTYRFPEDPVDRIWPPYTQVYPSLVGQVTDISTSQPISNSDYDKDNPPEVVMQTAITAPLLFNFTDTFPTASTGEVLYFSMFVAEYNSTLAPSDKLVMDYSNTPLQYPGGSFFYIPISIVPQLVPPLATYQVRVPNVSVTGTELSWYFSKNEESTLDPVLSAVELYSTQALAPSTSSVDGVVLSKLRTTLPISTWGGDPCFPVPWDEINCTTAGRVTSVNLFDRGLIGKIPGDFGGLSALIRLDLSRNNFSGDIPSELEQLSSLHALNVSDNKLTGAFPNWLTLLPLKELDVSNNDLSGAFPDSLPSTLGSSFRYSGNPQLSCSGPSCPPTPPSTTPTTRDSPPPPSSKGSSSSIGPIVGGIVGGIVFILVLGLLLCYCLRGPTGQKDGPLDLAGRKQAHPFTLRAIKIATSNYSRQIGEGGFGPVFHGVLEDNREVAVKVMSAASKQGFQEFATEIDLLSALHHRNLVSLVGYCQESAELVLLYEYMAGGDLKHRLHGPTAKENPLSWKQRLQIALDAARGLEYLHHGCTPRIIHRDVKSTNILLTSTLDAKYSDFGLSKLTDKSHVRTTVQGTLGYLDPEYDQTGVLTDKSDVYSFGVILLEMICGQPPIVAPDEAKKEGSLANRVQSAMDGGSIHPVIDPCLAGKYRSESAWKFAEIAMSCVRLTSSQRPNFIKIVTNLSQAVDMEDSHSDPNNGSNGTHTSDVYTGAGNYLESVYGFSKGFYLADEMPSQIFHAGVQPPPR